MELANKQMHSNGNKRRFALLFASGDLQRCAQGALLNNRFCSFFILFLFSCLIGCSGDYPHSDQEVSANGEPPKALVQVHSARFLADEKNYVLALGQIHSFLISKRFSTSYSDCFDDVLDIRKRMKGVSCTVLRAEQGPPTKVYFRVVVEEVSFNQSDGNNRLIYAAEIYALDRYVKDGSAAQLVQDFESGVASKLVGLYSGDSAANGDKGS